jgi:hypothetical protein
VQPVRHEWDVSGTERLIFWVPVQCHERASLLQHRDELLGVDVWHERVTPTSADEHALTGQEWRLLGGVRQCRPEPDRGGQKPLMLQTQNGRERRSVADAQCNNGLWVKPEGRSSPF